MIARLPDWERRLAEFIARPVRFEWGVEDCALWSCAAVQAITGEHPYPEFIGQYDDRIGAAKALRRLGKGTLAKTFGQKFDECLPAMARRGDVVMAMDALGICMGAYGLFLGDADELVRLPRAAFSHAWRVG